MFEFFEHTADLGLRIRGATLDELFADAGRALFAAIVANLDTVTPAVCRRVEVAGRELDWLLFDWLNELLYLFESERLLLSRFSVSVHDGGLTASVEGETSDPARHQLEHEVKAITVHGLRVEATADGWLAEVVVDI